MTEEAIEWLARILKAYQDNNDVAWKQLFFFLGALFISQLFFFVNHCYADVEYALILDSFLQRTPDE